MEDIDLDPIQVLRWALEKVSPADVVRSSARESFQRFLRRGTKPQLQQLLLEVQELGISSVGVETDRNPRRSLYCNTAISPIFANNEREHGIKRKHTFPNSTENSSRTRAPLRRRKFRSSISDIVSPSPTPSHSQSVVSSTDQLTTAMTWYPEASGLSHSPQNIQSDLSDSQSQCSSPYSSYNSQGIALPSMGRPQDQPTDVISEAKKYFATRLGDRRCRLNHLVRAIQGFIEAPALTPDFARNMWNARSAIFDELNKADSTSRLRNLYKGHRRIKGAREQYSYAARFSYIYLEHDLEELSKSQSLVLSQGRGKMTAAFELQAEIISTTVDVVKTERKAGRGYLQLLMEGGPGFVLRLGCNVSTIWERKLSNSDISLIIEFVKTETLGLYNDIRSYDRAGTNALLDGFLAYGWTAEEILGSKSFLFDRLRQYVDLNELLTLKPGLNTFPIPARSVSSCMEPQPMQSGGDCDQTQIIAPIESDHSRSSSTDSPVTPDFTETSESSYAGSVMTSSLVEISDAELDLLFSVEMSCSEMMDHSIEIEGVEASSMFNELLGNSIQDDQVYAVAPWLHGRECMTEE